MPFDANTLLSTLAVAGVGLFTFLVKSFFGRIHDDLKTLRSSVDKLDGRFDLLQGEGRQTVTELAVVRQELKAVWRFVDRMNEEADEEEEN